MSREVYISKTAEKITGYDGRHVIKINARIELKFGNKPTATNLGGFNVFGKRFGDYPQDISLALSYDSD